MKFWAAFLRLCFLFLLLSSGFSQTGEVASPEARTRSGGRVPGYGTKAEALPGRPIGRRGQIP
ncbi:hypothetical protein H6P81_010906 [Aristolochia fimbriata]|uniref:Uncharacterized protein n=1 Tax=Aristolochia fimbriata TaxID=158543 RepID=A0AAV7ESV4_ARIFI|nr:hypothetical protein H6P81_010906 [Aristolochia fimbriata]